MGPRRQRLVAEAAAGMLRARLSLALFPFARVARGLGTLVPVGDPRIADRAALATSREADIAKQVRWAVGVAAPHMPIRAVCLQQAMAARAMLQRRGIASILHLGARKGVEDPLEGHAWLDAAGVRVTGYPLDPELVELGCFI